MFVSTFEKVFQAKLHVLLCLQIPITAYSSYSYLHGSKLSVAQMNNKFPAFL